MPQAGLSLVWRLRGASKLEMELWQCLGTWGNGVLLPHSSPGARCKWAMNMARAMNMGWLHMGAWTHWGPRKGTDWWAWMERQGSNPHSSAPLPVASCCFHAACPLLWESLLLALSLVGMQTLMCVHCVLGSPCSVLPASSGCPGLYSPLLPGEVEVSSCLMGAFWSCLKGSQGFSRTL